MPPAALIPKLRGLKLLHIDSTINIGLLKARARTCVKIDFKAKFQNILLVLGSKDPLILVQGV